jgi:dGTPase
MEAALVDELGHRGESRTDQGAWETRIVADRPDHDPADGGPTPDLTPRARQWAATMAGHGSGSVRHAHADTHADVGDVDIADREVREAREDDQLAPGATRADGAGSRAVEEDPDPWRTCFERDRDRIVHGTAFRRLAGKTQVFVFPDDHQRTRLTHALEVAQVATSIARACRLNVALAEAIALGHDCGHGPFGHASEDALAPFVEGGYDHATWGADVVLAPLNLCTETLDGIRNHSWSRPAPSTPEGEVVSWADRIAYLCHDFEDAVLAGVVGPDDLPDIVAERCGRDRRQQLHAFISAVVHATAESGTVGMHDDLAEALTAFRAFNYERIYLRDESRRQAVVVDRLLIALVEWYRADPARLVAEGRPIDDATDIVREAVSFVGGMTDRFAHERALSNLGWDAADLPIGLETHV